MTTRKLKQRPELPSFPRKFPKNANVWDRSDLAHLSMLLSNHYGTAAEQAEYKSRYLALYRKIFEPSNEVTSNER
jgi:hypothetical protein